MTGLRGRTALIFLSQTRRADKRPCLCCLRPRHQKPRQGCRLFRQKNHSSMRMGPKLVPLFGIWLNCAVPAPVSKVFLVMEVLGRVTVKMVDPGVNCGSLDWL